MPNLPKILQRLHSTVHVRKKRRSAKQKINQHNPEKFVKNELATYCPTLRLNITLNPVYMGKSGKDGISRMRFIFFSVVAHTTINKR